MKPKKWKIPSGDLVTRFSKQQAEFAAKVSNDISEGIDCGEPRQALRMTIAYFADVACVEAQERAALKANLDLFRAAKGLMDTALSAAKEGNDNQR